MAKVGKCGIRLIKFFDSPLCAGLALLLILITILGIYILWSFRTSPVMETNWEEMVTAPSGRFLEININMAGLFKKYRADHIADAKTLADQYLDSHRADAFEARRSTYQRIAVLGCHIKASSGAGASRSATSPNVISSLLKNQTVYIHLDNGEQSIRVPCSKMFPQKPNVSEDIAIKLTTPQDLLAWVDNVSNNLCQDCTSLKNDLEASKTYLNDLINSEDNLIRNARAYFEALDDGLSFDFLLSEDPYVWVIHLIVWSWIGVIVSGFAQIVVKLNNREPAGLNFIFISIRFITAPIIAFVFVATITYGLTDKPVALNHAPMFLIFAFATGYMSESFNLMLRQGLNRLIPSFGLDTAKLKDAADMKAAARRILTRPKSRVNAVATIPELEKTLTNRITEIIAEAEAKAAKIMHY